MTYFDLAKAIDQVEREVTLWEAGLLETVLRAGPHGHLSEKQQQKLRELGEAYLPYHIMVEFQGQGRLL